MSVEGVRTWRRLTAVAEADGHPRIEDGKEAPARECAECAHACVDGVRS